MAAWNPGGGKNPQRGATEGAAKPRLEARIVSQSKASKSRRFVRGSRLAGERMGDNGMEATPGDEPGRLRIGRNPWTEKHPGRGCGMK
jgi:hypothetical protein